MLKIFVDETDKRSRVMQKSVRKLSLHFIEDSFRERLGLIRGSVKQTEEVYCVTKKPLEMTEVKRPFFNVLSSTNRGESIAALKFHLWAES